MSEAGAGLFPTRLGLILELTKRLHLVDYQATKINVSNSDVYDGAPAWSSDGTALVFDRIPVLPIPDATRIGFATWDQKVKLEAIELEVPKR